MVRAKSATCSPECLCIYSGIFFTVKYLTVVYMLCGNSLNEIGYS